MMNASQTMNASQVYLPAEATYGSAQLSPNTPSEITLGQSLLYAAIGAALGILIVTASAFQFRHAGAPAEAQNSAQAASAPAVTAPPVAKPLQTPWLERGADSQAIAPVASSTTPAAPSPVAVKAPALLVTASFHKSRSARRASFQRLSFSHRKPQLKRIAYVSPRPAVLAKFAPVTEPIRYQEQLPVALFFVEGDVTVAGFDSTAGLIETQEGMKFVLDRNLGGADSSFWEDYSGNVHYRCDPARNCTLVRSGITIPNARRAS